MPFFLYVLLSWTTKDRAELIDAVSADFLRRFLPVVARRFGAETVAMGVVPDHVHALLLLPAVIDIHRLVQGLKGASARAVDRGRGPNGGKLKWASGYDLRSVSPNALERVMRYVESHKTRHPQLLAR